jgi:glycosyltransferase involved in cell wall biosynthesis
MTATSVAVLIPAYRAEATLAETLDTVLAQTWPIVEIIVVDDGSPDGTLGVARSYEARGVRVYTQANFGAASARNRAFAASTGEFVQFLDADDLLAPDKIEAQMRRLAAEPEGTVASAAWARFQTDPAEADFEKQPDWRDFEPARGWLIQAWSGRGTMFPGAWLLPRPVAEAAGPWDERLSLNDDGEYNARVLTVATKVAFCPDAKAYYRSGSGGNLSARRDVAAMESARLACERSVAAMLAVDGSPEARRACASLWQFLAVEAYPDFPAVAAEAEAQAAALGGGALRPSGGRLYNAVRDVAGWKAAARVQRAADRLRGAVPRRR